MHGDEEPAERAGHPQERGIFARTTDQGDLDDPSQRLDLEIAVALVLGEEWAVGVHGATRGTSGIPARTSSSSAVRYSFVGCGAERGPSA